LTRKKKQIEAAASQFGEVFALGSEPVLVRRAAFTTASDPVPIGEF
jgi:hypothetical protein